MASTPSRPNHPFPPASTSSPAFPQHSHLHQRTFTTSSASSASFPPVATPSPPAASISLDSLLSAHASSTDPKLAALDQAVNERNTLSSQNAQLWKLIEKQRTGYNQILKELERVRSERDGYKVKLSTLVASPPDRRQRQETVGTDKERPNGDMPRPLQAPTDDPHTPHSNQPPNPGDRPRQQDITTFPSFQSNSTATPPRQKPSPTPLLVPPRAESLPVPASATGSANSENAPFSHTARLVVRSDSTPSTAHSSAPQTPPQHRSPLATAPQTAVYTPQNAPAGFPQASAAPEPSRGHAPTSSTSTITLSEAPQIITSSQSPVEVSSQSASPVQPPSAGNTMLAALNGSRSQPLSRESRISLPDEARQYIANMGESPIPSPKVDAFNTPRALPSAPAASVPPAGAPPQSEFLDLDDEPEDEDEDDDRQSDDEDEDEASDAHAQAPSLPPTQPLYAPRKPQAAAFEFPLPPSTVSPPFSQGESHAQAPPVQQAQDRVPPANPSAQQQIQQQRALAQQQQQQQMHLQQQQQQQSQQPPQQPPMQPQFQPQAPPAEILSPLQPLRPTQGPGTVPASFRALPLISTDLPTTTVTVSHSFVRPNDRGKEVLSFVVFVDPGNNKEGWKVEKMYSDVLALDQRVRNSVGKNVGKKMVTLPEGKLWKDHAPAKVDQRKAILETYLQALINLPVKNNDEVIAFFTSDIVREYKQPVMQAGHKEGYLTKRGKNFGGWKTRFFVLQGPVLEYYDCRGGAHLGSITITGAQIGRQQRSDKPTTDEEKEYRHAFLIVEAKKGPGGNHPRHVLCAESDADRDAWVEILVRYFTGTYSEEPVSYGQTPSASNGYPNGAQSRPSADVNPPYARSSSPARSLDYTNSPVDRHGGNFNDSQAARRVMEQQRPQPSSLPDSSPLAAAASDVPYQRANSEQGYYPDMQNGTPRSRRQHSPEHHRVREGAQKGFQPTLNTVVSSPITPVPPQQSGPVDRAPSPEKPESKVKISGPLNGAPIPAGYKFGKDAPPPDAPPSSAVNDRREKAKSRSFWGFGRPGAGAEKVEKAAHAPTMTFASRAVFGVTLEESLDVAQIANLPAIVFRCIQYLEAKKADQEEGIYRLSGSSAVIKSLKDRFNMEGDIDLLGSDEYWDPHAIAGLLKSFLRELPASILTHNLHLRFLSVIDFVDPQERIRELSQLIAALPFANYSLLRALTAHLILIVQNSAVNKMTMRNVGIVFSPTLGIPAGVFSLMLSEFSRVFNVDDDGEHEPAEENKDPSPDGQTADTHRRRNSHQYTNGAADQLLGLSGRTLASAEEGPSDDDSIQYDESGTETTEDNATAESSSSSSPAPGSVAQHEGSAVAPPSANAKTKAASIASSKGLNVSLRGNRYSTMMGLPASPRPPGSPRVAGSDGM